MIEHSKIRLQINYVLIKPDLDHTHYHLDGKEFLEIGSSCFREKAPEDSFDSDMQETNFQVAHSWATTGTVYQIPEKLEFFGKEISALYGKIDINDKHTSDYYQRINEASLEYGTENEVKIGDKVMFFYNEHVAARETGRCIDTDLGEMYLIKYDNIEAKVVDGSLYPLNGYVFFEEIEPKLSEKLSVIKEHNNLYERNGIQKGIVHTVGKPIRGTKTEVYSVDPTNDLKPGDTIYFEGYAASLVEADGQQIYFGRKNMYKIRRTEILMTS